MNLVQARRLKLPELVFGPRPSTLDPRPQTLIMMNLVQARRLKLPEWVFDDIWEMCLDSRVGALPLPATLTAFQRQQVIIYFSSLLVILVIFGCGWRWSRHEIEC